MQRQRGFTLIEVLLTVAIVSIVTAGSIGLTQSTRSAAVATTALRFDSLLDAARTTAYEFDRGATIVFAPDASGDGFTARLYRNRPSTGPLVPTTLPLLEARVAIKETELLGPPGFALTIHGNGSITGIIGNALSGNASAETFCPPSGHYHVVLSYGGVHVDRFLTCRTNLAATGPIAYSSIVPATPQPPPTPFACVAVSCASLPSIPKLMATCPPGYFPKDAATCESASSTVAPGPVPTATPTPFVGGAQTPTPTPAAQHGPISPNMCGDLRRWGKANGFPGAADNVFGYHYNVSDHHEPSSVFTAGNLETTESFDYTPIGYDPYANSIKLVSIYDSVPDTTRWVCQPAP